jgi:hypothetical protein
VECREAELTIRLRNPSVVISRKKKKIYNMPGVIYKALRSGHAWKIPTFTARMLDRKVRWETLGKAPTPFGVLDKEGQKKFAHQHGAEVATTLALIDRAQVAANPSLLRMTLDALPQPSTFVLKPASGYQNRNTYAVHGGHDLLSASRFDADAVAASIARDAEFDRYIVEECLFDEVTENPGGASGRQGMGDASAPAKGRPPMDYKFWCFGSTIAHVTIMCERWKDAEGTYHVDYADCDAAYVQQPTWCTEQTDVASGAPVALPARPHCWDEMVATARRLGEAVGVFTRIDFYATPRGPVFGEFQLLFDLVDWNENAERAIRAHWRGRDGAVERSHPSRESSRARDRPM